MAHQTTHFDEDEDFDGQEPGYLPIDVTHSGLAGLVMIRDAAHRALQGRKFELEQQVRPQKGTTDYWIHIDPIIDDDEDPVPWSGLKKLTRVGLLSWTSKMGTPSFSLPAGAPAIGGSCPGASAGQSVTRSMIRKETIRGQERVVLETLGMDPDRLTAEQIEQTALDRAVCQHCYATDGNYQYTSLQIAQLIRMFWTQKAIEDGTFVDVMIDAIDNADWILEGSKARGQVKDLPEPDRWRESGWRFFRIHDSGDFGWMQDFAYLRAWKEIADAFAPGNPDGLEPISFWAPTRIWAMRSGRQAVNDIIGSDDKGNFLLRPSGYFLDVPAPADLGPGWAGGSTVYSPAAAELVLAGAIEPAFDWDCEAYAVADGPSCRGALAPDGEVGCRACWAYADQVINYRAH